MTRINLIPIEELSDQHLLAEMRELPRIFSHVKKYGISKNIPEKFCLGKGHVIFFTNKLEFLSNRYISLIKEWEIRGFNWNYNYQYFLYHNKDVIKSKLQIKWNPTIEEIELSRQRIEEKIKQKPKYYKWTIII